MAETSKTEDSNNNIKVRCLVQQCTKARLYVKLADKDKNIEPEYVEVLIHLLKKKTFFIYI